MKQSKLLVSLLLTLSQVESLEGRLLIMLITLVSAASLSLEKVQKHKSHSLKTYLF